MSPQISHPIPCFVFSSFQEKNKNLQKCSNHQNTHKKLQRFSLFPNYPAGQNIPQWSSSHCLPCSLLLSHSTGTCKLSPGFSHVAIQQSNLGTNNNMALLLTVTRGPPGLGIQDSGQGTGLLCTHRNYPRVSPTCTQDA